MVRFEIHPRQDDVETTIECTTEVFDIRSVSDSGGHQEMRYVIRTPVRMGDESFLAEITLTNRDTMAFRMLLGRRAMEKRFIVDPDTSFFTRRGDQMNRAIMSRKKPARRCSSSRRFTVTSSTASRLSAVCCNLRHCKGFTHPARCPRG